jgi:hypothetical protein
MGVMEKAFPVQIKPEKAAKNWTGKITLGLYYETPLILGGYPYGIRDGR